MLPRFSTAFSPTKPDIFPRLCQELRWASHVSIQCDFLVLEWLAMIVLLSSLFVPGKWLSFTGSWTCENPFFIFFLFTEKPVRIAPPTSLFIISHPVCDAIVRKQTKSVTQQMLLEWLPSTLVFPLQSVVRLVFSVLRLVWAVNFMEN